MNDINVFMCVGRLTRKPELKYTPSGKAVAKFGLAVNKSFRKADGEEVKTPLFLNITTWNKVAENVAEYLDKGSKVAIQGSLKSNSWEDKEGNKRTSFEIVAFMVQFLDSRTQATEEPIREESVEEVVDSVINQTELPF